MTIDEARKVARIVSQADGGCDSCVRHMMTLLNEADLGFVWAFPDYDWYDRPETRSLEVTPRIVVEAGYSVTFPWRQPSSGTVVVTGLGSGEKKP